MSSSYQQTSMLFNGCIMAMIGVPQNQSCKDTPSCMSYRSKPISLGKSNPIHPSPFSNKRAWRSTSRVAIALFVHQNAQQVPLSSPESRFRSVCKQNIPYSVYLRNGYSISVGNAECSSSSPAGSSASWGACQAVYISPGKGKRYVEAG
jgi:hypothetical protein